jgi:acyl carrier protein
MDANNLKIRTFLSRYIRANCWQDSDDIFAMGFINSLFAMQLVLWIEREFVIKVENDDLEIENFNSVDNIASFVARKSCLTMSLNDAVAYEGPSLQR